MGGCNNFYFNINILYIMCFYKDLLKGQFFESLAIDRMLKTNSELTLINTNNDYKYDFKLSNNLKYEVKYSGDATKYIFVEFYSWGKASGITTTESDYYIFVLPEDKYLLITTPKLRELCEYSHWAKRYEDRFKKGFLFLFNTLITNGIFI